MSSIGSSYGGIDSSVLLGYYQAQLTSSPTAIAAANAQNAQLLAQTQKASATANDDPPWNTPNTNDAKQDAKVLSTTNYLDTSNVPLSAGATSDSKLEQDNQKLFSLYSAVNTLAYLAKMAQSPTATSGQLAGLNTRFQTGLAQVEQYLSSTGFNNFNLQSAKPSDTASSTAQIAFSDYTYATKQLVTNANLDNALPGVSASDSFNIAIKKNGSTINVPIDLSQVSGTLNLTNIVTYINSQLSAAGVATRFQKTESGGTATSDANATYGIQITPGGVEQVSLSAAATPALYLVGNSGLATETNTVTNTVTNATTTTAADQTGRVTKLSGLDGTPTTTFSVNQQATTGTTTAQASVVDASGSIYVIGNATGNFGNQLNQGTQDVYLTKYDSAGNVVWQNLLGSAGSANGYGLALDPSGGVVVTGATTADLTPTAVADGNNDSFVARYDASGNQTWIQQIQTLTTNQANAVTVDASGNIYIGGSVGGFPVTIDGEQKILPGGVIGAGQTNQGGSDAFLVKLDSKGKVLAESQFGTGANDSVAATATGPDGSLYVASVQNGHAILSKYAGGDITSAPTWTQDLGDLQAGGSIGGLAVSGSGQIYVSGATSNANLTSGGQAGIAAAANGGIDAFVAGFTDNGASVSADTVSYVGTSGNDTAGDVTVAADGTVYLSGTTMGSFPGAQRTAQDVSNAFAAALNSDGTVKWTKQFGGADGVSTGAGIAIDTQGSSVLDALGLPRGTINLNQSVDLTNQTTLRAGDSFQIQIQGVGARTATITIDQGETFDSLVTKINAQLGRVGKASVNYSGSGENLKIQVNAGNTINLVAGPQDLDALSRLGIAAGVLTAPADGTASTTSSATSGSSDVLPTYGLGLTGSTATPLDISTKTGADLARATLLGVLSSIQSTYQTTNTPPPSTTKVGNTSGTASAATTAQLANYSMALSLMNADPSNAVANIQAIIASG
ncbi:MAG TPA: hypothetical protein VHC40_03760 [Rhizomicrobium sp.]|nr:hypothetical protein [Rhizomicrobium sp.]